jgi:ABC-type lipoprotein export system ATPase subunit
MVKLLQQAAHKSGTTIIAASHDPDVITAADTKLTLRSHEERNVLPRRPTLSRSRQDEAAEE